MTIAYESSGALAYVDSGALDIPYPAGVADGDLLIVTIGQKPSSANGGTMPTPTDWARDGVLTGAGGYGATLGLDTGNTNIYVFSTTADGTETGNLSITPGTNNVAWGQMHRLSKTMGAWRVAVVTGSDTVGGSVSVTFGANPGLVAGDYVLAAMCIPTDVTTPSQFSSQNITATGATIGARTEISEPDSSLGNDIGGFIVHAAVTAGTASAAPVLTATAGGTTTNVRGPAALIRVREYDVPADLAYDESSPAALNGSGAGNLTTAAFSPPDNTLVTIFAGAGEANPGPVSIACTSSDGGTWEDLGIVQGINASGGAQAFRRYYAHAPGPITVTLTYTGFGSGGGRLLLPIVFSGADPDQSTAADAGQVRSSGTAGTVAITTTRPGAQVWGIGNHAVANASWTPNGDTLLATEFTDGVAGHVIKGWAAALPVTTPGVITLGGTWGSSGHTNIIAMEIIPPAVGPGPARLGGFMPFLGA